jgi:hypothetical protein
MSRFPAPFSPTNAINSPFRYVQIQSCEMPVQFHRISEADIIKLNSINRLSESFVALMERAPVAQHLKKKNRSSKKSYADHRYECA